MLVGPLDTERWAMFLWNVGNLLPRDVSSYPRRTESSTTPLWKPQDSTILVSFGSKTSWTAYVSQPAIWRTGNFVQPLWRSEVGKFVTIVKWPRENTSSRHGHETKSEHFFKWEFLKMGWRVHYSATVECRVLENRVMRRLTTQTLKSGTDLASSLMKVLSGVRAGFIHIKDLFWPVIFLHN
jgi:hypothetical protein